MQKDRYVKASRMVSVVLALVLPMVLIIYGTVRIFIVVVRTHRQISVLEQSVTVGNTSIGNTGFVTVQAMRSSKSVIVICIVTLLLNIPPIVYVVLRDATSNAIPDAFSFASMWLFEGNTFVNSLLYLTLFKSVRQKVVHMTYALLVYIRALR